LCVDGYEVVVFDLFDGIVYDDYEMVIVSWWVRFDELDWCMFEVVVYLFDGFVSVGFLVGGGYGWGLDVYEC